MYSFTTPLRIPRYLFPRDFVATRSLQCWSMMLKSQTICGSAPQRCAESSKELKDNDTAAVILRLADLYDWLAHRAEFRKRYI